MALIFFLLSGCYYTGKKSSYGLPRRPIKTFENHLNNYTYIDTAVLYKADIDFHYNNSLKRYSYYDKVDDNPYPYVSYLKFYGNGKVGLFVISKSDTTNLTHEDFNPQKAKMGYYMSTSDGLIKTHISTIGDGTLFISKEEGIAWNDSLKLQKSTNHGTIYKKIKIPDTLIRNWQPDW